jgi:hypothetical protein
VCSVIVGGDYSSLTLRFDLAREVGYHILDYYVPSIVIVAMSWVTFWLHPNEIHGRTSLGKLRAYADDQLLASSRLAFSHLAVSVPLNRHIQVTADILQQSIRPNSDAMKARS